MMFYEVLCVRIKQPGCSLLRLLINLEEQTCPKHSVFMGKLLVTENTVPQLPGFLPKPTNQGAGWLTISLHSAGWQPC